jgi:hypothetical protein
MIWPSCGELDIEDDPKFCPHCGTNFDSVKMTGGANEESSAWSLVSSSSPRPSEREIGLVRKVLAESPYKAFRVSNTRFLFDFHFTDRRLVGIRTFARALTGS